MGRAAMAHSSLVRGLCAAWLFFVAVSAVHEDADTPTPLVDGELGASKAKAYAFYCTPKGEMSPEYAYNDKHCASNGKLQPCGEVWCCGGTAAKTGLYTCGRSQRVSTKLCTGVAPKCSGPKPGEGSKGGKTGCRDTHDAICQAAKLYGHCKHSDYASQCAASCGKCAKVSKTTVKRVLAKVAAKRAIKKMKKTDAKVAKKTAKKKVKKARKAARKAAKLESKKEAKKKKAKKALKKAKKKEKKAARKVKKKAKRKLKKAKKKAKKKVKKAVKKVKKAKAAVKAAKKVVQRQKAKLKVKLAKKKAQAAAKKEDKAKMKAMNVKTK